MNVGAVRIDCDLRVTNRLALLLLTFCLPSILETAALDSGDSSAGGEMGYLNSIISTSGQLHADEAPVSGGGLRYIVTG